MKSLGFDTSTPEPEVKLDITLPASVHQELARRAAQVEMTVRDYVWELLRMVEAKAAAEHFLQHCLNALDPLLHNMPLSHPMHEEMSEAFSRIFDKSLELGVHVEPDHVARNVHPGYATPEMLKSRMSRLF